MANENREYEDLLRLAYENRNKLILDPNSGEADQYRQSQYTAIESEKALMDQTLGAAELSAYQMLGRQQLELETLVAEQRKTALKSGVTSAQLASMQLQNMFAAQTGASGVANNVMQQRITNTGNYASKRAGVESSLYDYILQNQTVAGTTGAQNVAALGSLASYKNQYYNNLMGLSQARTELGNDLFDKLYKTD